MKVLAIIPACEGSSILPNKNMRVIHGKPMIYHVINNAICSKHVTDIIVTSNSNEIISLARRMGVMTRRRAAELSNSEVSLDRVVWDVFEQLDLSQYDVVVTMQSISPTLTVQTLDKAFELFFEKNFDTLISVRKQQQFSWTVSDGIPIPAQPKRMNRHLLPPSYMETGAFLITKAHCIAEDTRIGENVGIFELEGDESIDVYSFGDLKQAENAMNRQSTAIYVNGNDEIGLGHISRAFQVADELFNKPDFFYDRNKTDRLSFGNTTYNLIAVDGDRGFIEELKNRHYDIIINDILSTSEFFMSEVRRAASDARIINFEDEGSGAKYADAVINALYENDDASNVISGSKYFIISKLFLLFGAINICEKIKNVIVTFGGADPQNYTETILKFAVMPEYAGVHFYVVLGKANKRVDLISNFDSCPNITVLSDIDNMAEIMSQCDAAISSRGRTCFELAALGIPTLSIAQHDREAKHLFVCEDNGFLCIGPGSAESCIKEAFHKLLSLDMKSRTQMQNKMLAHDLRSGRKNVAEIIGANI